MLRYQSFHNGDSSHKEMGMKTSACIATLAISSVFTAAWAGSPSQDLNPGQGVSPGQNLGHTGYQISPFNLAYLAYRGTFKAQGISGYATFCSNLDQGDLDAQDVMNVAIDTLRLNPSFADDESYENSLQQQMEGICRN
jgi:hypothetical protein